MKFREGSSGSLYYERKTVFTYKVSGNRRRFFKTSEKRYPSETTSDTGSEETTFSYTYHSSDALAVAKRTTTLPIVTTGENGPGTAVSPMIQ